MSLFTSKGFIGLIAGLSVPPILTKTIFLPYFIESRFYEIDDIKHDLDTIGWKVRNLEEIEGWKEDDIYTPVSYFQPRY